MVKAVKAVKKKLSITKRLLSRTVATLMDKFEANTPEFDHFVTELRNALTLISSVETENEPTAQAG